MNLFSSMAGGALLVPSLILLPAIFALLIGIGLFSNDDIIEDDIYKIWASERSKHFADIEYRDSLGFSGGSSSLLAIATSRDGGNLFVEDRLNEIKTKMDKMEDIVVNYTIASVGEEVSFTWKDACASNNIGVGTVYQFPCVRLSAMDLWEESKDYFTDVDRVSWYNKGIVDNVVNPRVGKFGILASGSCGACLPLLAYRFTRNEELLLFSDLTAMRMNDPCRICVDDTYEAQMQALTSGVKQLFYVMYLTISKYNSNSTYSSLLEKVMFALDNTDQSKVEEFYKYYVTRGIYSQLGAAGYIAAYTQVLGSDSLQQRAESLNVTIGEIAQLDLLAHADAAFSSINTAGNPLPLSLPLGFPHGGSGINLSGTILGSIANVVSLNPFDLITLGSGNLLAWNPVVPESDQWVQEVENDPIYQWFITGQETMIGKCSNDLIIPVLTGEWCTQYSLPLDFEERSKVHFAKMWYDLLTASPNFLNIAEGESDPYTWTTGEGCGYSLAGKRASYTGKSEEEILFAASRDLYFIDEGSSIGALDKSLLIGGTVGSGTATDPYGSISSIQNIYPALIPSSFIERVKNCNRPGGPVNVTFDEARKIIETFKTKMVDVWSEGWDEDEAGEVQFTGFFDSVGVSGTFNVVLRDISDDSSRLSIISVIIIAIMSMLFLFNKNMVQSRMGITLVGVLIVILSFVASLGFAVLIGIKINVTMAWTLPFIMIGLGVDDMYIVLNAIQTRRGDKKEDFVEAMLQVISPVTMTSVINASMFAMMQVVDIGAIYRTAQAAVVSVVFLYLSIIFCFPAYCYLDIKRQESKRCDILMCIKINQTSKMAVKSEKNSIFFPSYRSMFLASSPLSSFFRAAVMFITAGLFAWGVYGITSREIGVGIEDFFPSSHQAFYWATVRANDLASWPISMHWGRIDYTNPENQILMMKQFEDVVGTTYVTQIDTRRLWIADFNLWTTKQCQSNFVRSDPEVKECGADQLFIDNDAADNSTFCEGTWVENTYGLREMAFDEITNPSGVCSPFKGGICHPYVAMFPDDIPEGTTDMTEKSFCPVTQGWSERKLKFCIEKWILFTGGTGGLLRQETESNNEVCPDELLGGTEIQSPIPISTSPVMYTEKMFTHRDTVKMIEETRAFCDNQDTIHCFMAGIPFDYWEQYISIDTNLIILVGSSVAVAFLVATIFLFMELNPANESFTIGKRFFASLIGGVIIAITIVICLIPIMGISMWANVNLTAFSNMSFALSIGFATEYSVHIIHRFLAAPISLQSAEKRVEYSMRFLIQPLTLSFMASLIGVACLGFTEIEFTDRFFFRPLMCVMIITYFIGTFFLPIVLTKLDFEFLKVGTKGKHDENENENQEVYKEDA